jgi:hypothetical protein
MSDDWLSLTYRSTPADATMNALSGGSFWPGSTIARLANGDLIHDQNRYGASRY